MKTRQLHFNETNLLRPLTSDYINQEEATHPLYDFAPDREGIAKALEARRKRPVDRTTLVNALIRQYEQANIEHPGVISNIECLGRDNTFTITTGHQLNLFGGTQYFIYKIVEVINYTRQLKERFPNDQFIPVFWMATEDHDFDEINHIQLQGKRIEWNTPSGGAVGRLNPEPVLKVIDALKDFWDLEERPGTYLKELFSKAYSYPTLANATRYWVHELFASYGLVIIDGDDSELKGLFAPVMEAEFLREITHTEVEKTNAYLSANGYHHQVYSRPINLFYLTDEQRDRITKSNGIFGTADSDKKWSESELLIELNKYPERFSPNALMRPMYQETILPNLAYIGGAGEIAYWLQSKTAFEKHNVCFPQLIIRNSAVWINNRLTKKVDHIGLLFTDFFQRWDDLAAAYAETHTTALELFELSNELESLWKSFKEKSEGTFQELRVKSGVFAAEKLHELKKLKHDMRKVAKAKNKAEIKTLLETYKTFFPMGSFQERVDTFLPSYLRLGNHYFKTLFEHIEPMGHQVLVIDF